MPGQDCCPEFCLSIGNFKAFLGGFVSRIIFFQIPCEVVDGFSTQESHHPREDSRKGDLLSKLNSPWLPLTSCSKPTDTILAALRKGSKQQEYRGTQSFVGIAPCSCVFGREQKALLNSLQADDFHFIHSVSGGLSTAVSRVSEPSLQQIELPRMIKRDSILHGAREGWLASPPQAGNSEFVEAQRFQGRSVTFL